MIVQVNQLKPPSVGNKERDNAIKIFMTALQVDFDKDDMQNLSKELVDHMTQLVLDIEQSLFEKHNFMNDLKYKEGCRILYSNLKDKKNPDLRKKVINRMISMKDLVSCDPSVLISDSLKTKHQELQKESLQARNSDWYIEFLRKNASASNIFCIACKGKQVNTTCMQTRGADEPMTEFHECITCGKKWKC